MKIKHLLTAGVISIISIAFISCSNDWAAKVDDETISIDDFNKFYYMQSKMMANVETNAEVDKLAENPAYANHPMLNKTAYLDHLIAQKLLYKKALKDKNISKDELETLLEMIKIQTVAQYYLGKKLKDKITVSDEEVSAVYNQNKSKFAGRTADEATSYIKQQIFAQKSRQETNRYVMELIAESKVDKEGLKNYLSKNAKTTTPAVKTEEKK